MRREKVLREGGKERKERRKPVSCLLELMPGLPFNHLPIFFFSERKAMAHLTCKTSFLLLNLSEALLKPVFTFRRILIAVIIFNLLLDSGPHSQHFFPTNSQYLKQTWNLPSAVSSSSLPLPLVWVQRHGHKISVLC